MNKQTLAETPFPKPILCRKCGKKFWCHARVNSEYPNTKIDCATCEKCECDECNSANKYDKYCKNVHVYNPSNRFSSEE